MKQKKRSHCLLYKCINSSADAKALQEDLNNLQQWEKDCQMKFNPGKCEVIRISNKRKVVDSEYTIHGQIPQRTNKAKYLGVTIDSTLSWFHHIDNTITKKANNTTAFLRQNRSSCPLGVKATCYKALVRPQLGYPSSTWDSHTQSNISKIEAARFVTVDYRRTSSVSSMLVRTSWLGRSPHSQKTWQDGPDVQNS